MNGRRLLITGATGFIGRHVAAAAAARGAELHLVGRTTPREPGRFWPADLRDPARLREVVAQVRPDVILHLAAGGVAYGTGSVSELLLTNTTAAAALLEASAALPDPALVLLAGSGFEYRPLPRPHVETDPLDRSSPYALSKVAAEDAAQLLADRVPVRVLRIFGTYGPGERPPRLAPSVIEAARAGRPVELTSGEQLRDFAFVPDVAEAFLRLADRPAPPGLQAVNLGTGRPVSVRAFVEALAAALRRAGLAPALRFGAKATRPDERTTYVADVQRLRSELGWVPQTPLEEGLEKTVEATLAEAR